MLNVAVKPARILIAAEQPLEAMALETMLRDQGAHYAVRVTSDAREIAPLLDKWPFQLLVLDMGIRSQNSLRVLDQLSAHIQRRQLAVLALTEAGDTVARDCALGVGAAAVCARPFTRMETLKTVADVLASLPSTSVDDTVLRAVQKRISPIT